MKWFSALPKVNILSYFRSFNSYRAIRKDQEVKKRKILHPSHSTMIVAILLGFTYQHQSIRNAEMIYKFVDRVGGMSFILTDDPDNIAVKPNLKSYIIRSMQDVMVTVQNIDINSESQIIFYHDGSESNMITFPNHQSHSIFEFRELLLEQCSPMAQIIMLSNEGVDHHLAYKLNPVSRRFRLVRSDKMTDKVVLSICTSQISKLIECLGEKILDMSALVKKIDDPNLILTCSYPIDAMFWSWLYLNHIKIVHTINTTSLIVDAEGE